MTQDVSQAMRLVAGLAVLVVGPLRPGNLVWAEPTQMTSTFKVNLADPESSVPTLEQANRNPLEMGYFVMDLATAAETAQKAHDYAAVVKLYRAMAKAVPQRSISYTKQCEAYEAMGERRHAIDACWEALGRSGVEIDDFTHYVRLTLAGRDKLAKSDSERVDAVVAHLRDQAGGTQDTQLLLLAGQLACELGLRLEDVSRMERCTAKLSALAPKDPRTFAFRWSLALLRRDDKQAERVIGEAKQAKVPDALLAQMSARLQEERSAASRHFLQTRILPAVASGVALVMAWLALGRRRLPRPARA
jgi:hypothetical protein